MSFCAKCRKAVKVVAGACVICGVAVGAPAVSVQHAAGAASTYTAVTAGGHQWYAASHPLRGGGDSGDLPDPGEPAVTFDGQEWEYAGTAPVSQYMVPPRPDIYGD
jgi:hypothetical protein